MSLRCHVNQKRRPIARFVEKNEEFLLRLALAIVYTWFGALKILGVSPVSELVGKMSAGAPRETFVRFVGIWEVGVGIALLFRFALRLTLTLFFMQLGGTFLAFVLHRQEAFRNNNPFLLTFTGEFIIKNLVLLAAGLVICSAARRSNTKI